MAALAMKKLIISVFIKPEHIPSLLKARLGVEYDTFDLQKNLDNLYKDILKKSESRRIE